MLHQSEKQDNSDMRPDDLIPEWNLTPQVVEDLGDIHRSITEYRTSFSSLKSNNRSLRLSDLQDISHMLSLVEQIKDMTFMYITHKRRAEFEDQHDKITNQLFEMFRAKQIPSNFIQQVSQHMRTFYILCAESGLWIKSSKRGYQKRKLMFSD